VSRRCRPAVPPVLIALATDLLDAQWSAPGATPAVVVVRPGSGAHGVDVELHTTRDDLAALLPEVPVPRDVTAVGVLATGTGHHLDDGRSERVAVVHLCHRDGATVSGWRPDEGRPTIDRVGGCGAAATGRLPDGCRRALGLSTAPPASPVELLTAAVWLDRAVEAALAGTPLDGSGLDELRPPTFAGWSAARRAVAEGGLLAGDPATRRHAALAAWHDEGSFSRWVLEILPDPAEALDLLTDATSPAVRRAMLARLVGLLENTAG